MVTILLKSHCVKYRYITWTKFDLLLTHCGLVTPWQHISGSTLVQVIPDRKVHGASMGPTWALSAPDGHHAGPLNLATRDGLVPSGNLNQCWFIINKCLQYSGQPEGNFTGNTQDVNHSNLRLRNYTFEITAISSRDNEMQRLTSETFQLNIFIYQENIFKFLAPI